VRPALPAILLAAAALGAAADLNAQASDEQFVHWAYAPYFGTGSYQLGDSQQLYALRLAKRWRLREPELNDPELNHPGLNDGNTGRRVGIDLRVPVTIGTQHDRLGNLSGFFDSGNVSAISAVPGAEFSVPISERLTLKPLVYAGWGKELGGGDSAWIYWSGLKSQLAFEADAVEWWLINSLLVVGYTSARTPSESVLPLLTGLEFRKPLGDLKLGGDAVYLNWSVAYTRYLNSLDLRIGSVSVPSLEVDDEWEVALAFSKGPVRLKLWRLQFDRVGIAYRFGTDGRFTGVGVVFRSLFDR
jgi:hypothetical protein